MKRKQEECEGEDTVKRISSTTNIVTDQYIVQPQQLTTVQLLTPATSGPLQLGTSSVGTALTVPTAVAVTVQTDSAPSLGANTCILGGTITYTQPSSHTTPCNIVLASQSFAQTSLPVSESHSIANSNTNSSSPNIISVSGASPAGVIFTTADNNIITYSNTTTGNTLIPYSDNSNIDNNSEGSFCSTTASVSDNTTPSFTFNTVTPAPPPEPKTTLTLISEAKKAYISRRNQESVTERQERLTKRFDALIRTKIIELVTARGIKKTVCPSEVARGLSPKAWRDLMPAVRKIGAHLVHEGLILVTQRGTIVDLATARGPMREVEVGTRVECNGARGTVRYIGEVTETNGLWYGVDWDNSQRGKHDGSHNGVKYFTTRHPTSGSFVRPTKVSTGITLEAAVRDRYQADTTVSTQLTKEFQKNIKAKFVEIVGMEEIGAKQRQLEFLKVAVVGGCGIWGSDEVNLTQLFPCLHHLDISNSLLTSWVAVAHFTRQLPSLRVLDLSGNSLKLPESGHELCGSTKHITHLIMNNMLDCTWPYLMSCCTMFPALTQLKVAYNDLVELGPIPPKQLECLEELDLSANSFTSWTQINYLGILQRLTAINIRNCQLKSVEFPDVAATEKTSLFPTLDALVLDNNPLNLWDCSTELDKLPKLQKLVYKIDENVDPNLPEFLYARIQNLKALNHSRVTSMEKKDSELFYLKSFTNEYYNSGGHEELSEASLTQEFIAKHPSYLRLARVHGAPVNETNYKTKKSQKLKDLKIEVTIVTPDHPERESCVKSFLPTTKVAKVKMMLKRQLKINAAAALTLSYYTKGREDYEIPIDNDIQELSYYSMQNGDTLLVRW